MTNYIFLLELYFILTVLTFLYPKQVQKRNHIVNGILMGFFLVLVEVFINPSGVILSIGNISDLAISKLPKTDDVEIMAINLPILKQNFLLSILVPTSFFIIGRVLYSFGKITLSTFDTIYTGLFPFVVYFNFVIFLGINGLGGLIWHYILFFFVYGVFSYARISFFIFFGVKNLLDDISLNKN